LSAPFSLRTDRERYESRFVSHFRLVTSSNVHAFCTIILLLYSMC
jgi:hypothetical protein